MSDDRDYVLSCLRRAAENDYSWPVSPSEANALLAEIERLREEAHELRLMVEEAARAENANAEDAKKERAAVVAYLRAESRAVGASPDEKRILTWVSGRIRGGEHRREGVE